MSGADAREGLGAGPAADRRAGLRLDVILVSALVAACFVVYAPSLRGGFVYDDNYQILRNPMIQEGRFFWRALTHEVWAYRTPGMEGVSTNYWRPVFMLWMIAQHRLFGLASATPWHIASVALHAVVTALAYGVARRLGLGRGVSAVVSLIFAVHPTHVESVTWVSGSPDLLMGITVLGMMLCLLGDGARRSWWSDLAAGVLCLLALLSKEPAAGAPLLGVLCIAVRPTTERGWARARTTALRSSPLVAACALWVAGRVWVLGGLQHTGGLSWLSVLISLPEVALFYVRQMASPLWVGPMHPLRAVMPEIAGWWNFWAPLLACVVLGGATVWLARRSRAGVIGLGMLVLLLGPALNIRAFGPDQAVHDRYLYLPLLGAMWIVAGAAGEGTEARRHAGTKRRDRAWALAGAAAGAFSVLLSVRTVAYERCWMDEVSLWAEASRTDPSSADARRRHGEALIDACRFDEARLALTESLAMEERRPAYMALAELSVREGRLDEAEMILRAVVEASPSSGDAHEALALCLERARRLDEAAEALRAARAAVPADECFFTEQLAMVLRQKAEAEGRKAPVEEAICELEAYREEAASGRTARGALLLYRLGLLYGDAGRKSEGLQTLREFLRVTEDSEDRRVCEARRAVIAGFRKVAAQGGTP